MRAVAEKAHDAVVICKIRHRAALPVIARHLVSIPVFVISVEFSRVLMFYLHVQVFLCSLFAPVCLDRPVWPCRSLCEAVKSGCVDRMLKYGFPWPEMLRCDQFPSDNELCIGLRGADTHG